MSDCRICGAAVEPSLRFGPMPIANGFLREEDFADEPFFDLQAGLCPRCGMLQLTELLPREQMFHDRYPFFTGTSVRMQEHFRRLAVDVMARRLPEADPFVIEIGSNDGTFLQHLARAGIRHLGVEPSANVAAAAAGKGVHSLAAFFERETAAAILRDHGRADAIVATNCFCHIPDLHAVADGAATLLKPDGVLIFEDPYLADIVEKTAYDQIYDEHAYYFSLLSLRHWLDRHDLEIVDVERVPVHGGSIRCVAARRGVHPIAPIVDVMCREERSLGLDRPETFVELRRRIERSRDELVALLRDLRQQRRRIVGYGATSKSTTVLNYCGLSADDIEFISDTTPVKQGLFTPGTHIPVRPREAFAARYPDYALLFAWNHAGEIVENERPFRDGGGKWITYVPGVTIQ